MLSTEILSIECGDFNAVFSLLLLLRSASSQRYSFFNPIHGNSAENNWSRERGLKWIWEWVEPEL